MMSSGVNNDREDPLAAVGLSDAELPPVGAAPFAVGEVQLLAGRYAVEQQVSMGTSGCVYRGIDNQNRSPVAIKIFQWWDDDPIAMRRFHTEATVIRRLTHPNVVRLLDVGQTSDGVCFIVFEWLIGESLAAYLNRHERVEDFNLLLMMVAQCASALDAVHENNIVHRDLKPTNVFLTGSGYQTQVKLLDFGLSKLLEEATGPTDANTVMGSIGYMAPEQALGYSAEVDHRADIYGLAALVYRMLTGHPPIPGRSLAAVAHAIRNRVPRPPSELRAMPPQVDTALLRALSKQPEARQPSARVFYEQLSAALTP